MYYKMILIQSESDLPKEEGRYTFYPKMGSPVIRYYNPAAADKKLWVGECASYFLPVPEGVLYEKDKVIRGINAGLQIGSSPHYNPDERGNELINILSALTPNQPGKEAIDKPINN